MADPDSSSSGRRSLDDPDGNSAIEVAEIERPAWGTIVYRSVQDPGVLYLAQLVSVGPYKIDIEHVRRLTAKQTSAYQAGRLDYAALAEAGIVELNRSARTADLAERRTELASTILPFVQSQVRTTQSLAGRKVQSWAGCEMAIRSNDDESEFAFSDPHANCVQLSSLTATLTDGSITRFGNHQNDDEFGLTASVDDAELKADATPGHRVRPLDELPVGRVSSIATRMSKSGDLTEIDIGFGDALVRIVAGEIYETASDQLEFHRFDASLLVFTSRADYDAASWVTAI